MISSYMSSSTWYMYPLQGDLNGYIDRFNSTSFTCINQKFSALKKEGIVFSDLGPHSHVFKISVLSQFLYELEIKQQNNTLYTKRSNHMHRVVDETVDITGVIIHHVTCNNISENIFDHKYDLEVAEKLRRQFHPNLTTTFIIFTPELIKWLIYYVNAFVFEENIHYLTGASFPLSSK